MTQQSEFSGKTALVTGAGGGIGSAIALELARRGADIVAWERSETALEKLATATARLGRAFHGMAVDARDVTAVRKAMREAADLRGHIDILVNCAGVNRQRPALDVTEEDWDFILDINLKGSFFTAQAAALHMKEKGVRGRIINISSSLSHNVLPDRAPYLASKGGVNLITRSLALELAPCGITVNAIGPAIVDTEMTRGMGSSTTVHPKMVLGRLVHAEEIAAAAAYLASDAAAAVTGQVLFVDAGWTIH